MKRQRIVGAFARGANGHGERHLTALTSRSFIRLVVIAAIGLCLAGCGRTESYRYKLTLAVDTPQGVKRSSSVVEVLFYEVSFPEKGTMHKLRGEAVYLDLGPGARPLIALLTSHRQPKDAKNYAVFLKGIRWSLDAGPSSNILTELYGPRSADFMDTIARIGHTRGVHGITPNDLPDLVTFADVNAPRSVIEVDPNDLQATLGPGITGNKITLESTDEPVTTGLEMKLPWLPMYRSGMLDGDTVHYYGARATLANSLSTADFHRVDPEESRCGGASPWRIGACVQQMLTKAIRIVIGN